MSKYFEMASKLYQDGDKVSAFNAFLELAIYGNAEEQCIILVFFMTKGGVLKEITIRH